MNKFYYLMDYILFVILTITLSVSLKRHESLTDNPPIQIYVNKIENEIKFKIKSDYFELLTPETKYYLEALRKRKLKIKI